MTFKAVGKRTSEFRQRQAVIAKGQITKCSPRCQTTPGDTLHNCRLKNLTSLALCSMPKHCILKVLFSFFFVPSYWNSLNQEVLHFVIFKVVFKCLSKVIQFSSVAQSCLTLCDPMDGSMPGLPVHHQLPEFTQTHVHYVGDAIQPSHPLSSPSPPAFSLSQHQGLFQ